MSARPKLPKKAEVRQELDQLMQDFFANGGEIKQIERGASAFEHGYSERLGSLNPNKQTHTPLDEVANAIDRRRAAQKQTQTRRKSQTEKPKKKVIYDDFGEVVRVIWE